MKKLIVPVVLFLLLIAACSKDMQVVKQLDGDWKLTRATVNGNVYSSGEDNTIYTFEKCNVKKEDCPGTISTQDSTKGTISYPFEYSISDKGTKIAITIDFFGFKITNTGDIVEHSKSKFVYEYVDEDGDLWEETLEKQ